MASLMTVDVPESEVRRPAVRMAGCWFQRLMPEQQIEVVAAAERGASSAEIAWALKRWGEGATPSSLSLHLRGRCACRR